MKLKLKHWQDAVNVLLGVWMLVSPWALGFNDMTVAMNSAIAVGVLLIATALGAIFVPRAWEEWTEGVLGLWMIASPWVLGFSMDRQIMLSAVVSGVLVAVLAAWTLLTDSDYTPMSDGIAH